MLVTMLRAAGQSGQMTVTFALSGLGEARLDDVSIEVMEPNVSVPAGQPLLPGR